MKLRNLLYATLLLSSALVSGCDKDKDETDGDSQTKQDFTAASWKISNAKASGVDVTSQVPACYLDNLVTFNDDLTGSVNESAVVCTPTTAGNFTWSFNSSETEITLTAALIPGGNNTFKLVSVSSTALVLSQTTTVAPIPVPVELVVTLTHP